jgi:hypothetical protein
MIPKKRRHYLSLLDYSKQMDHPLFGKPQPDLLEKDPKKLLRTTPPEALWDPWSRGCRKGCTLDAFDAAVTRDGKS